ncbi:hypothetical protein M8J76_014810 [Diaphorina citri]|nr:hypothetical protein M8J75_007573 [Diaphorina citri]KAI5745857.1 hypothetical protein M8J76_014810 [Diaphorina citri]
MFSYPFNKSIKELGIQFKRQTVQGKGAGDHIPPKSSINGITTEAMKRFSDGGGYGGPGQNQGQGQQSSNFKRFRGGPNDVELRLLIPSRVAGSVIGKGGSNIARLRNDFKASVTVPDCPGPERILTIFAELENGLKVIEEVLPALDEIRQKYGKGRGGEDGGDGYNGGGVGGLGKDDYDIRLIVHQSQAGCIIGKGGTKIKELRDKTGARIKIYSNCCPQSTDRIAQIFGTAETAINCIREIMELLKTAPVKGADNPYDPHNFDDYYSDEYGGYGAGVGGGSTGPGGRGGGGGRFGTPGGGGGGRGGFGGPRAGGAPPPGTFGADGSFGAPPGPGGYYDAPPMGGAAGGYGPPGDLAGPGGMGGPGARNSTQVTIPKDMAGAIIGKAGQRIRKIRNDSGAGITIDEPLPGSNDRIITITGTASQIQMAQYLLQQSVREYGGA